MTDDPIKLFVVVMAILLCVLGFVSFKSYQQAAAFEKAIDDAGRDATKLREHAGEVQMLCNQLKQSKLSQGYRTLIDQAARYNSIRLSSLTGPKPDKISARGVEKRFTAKVSRSGASQPLTRDQIAKFCRTVERDSRGILKTIEIIMRRAVGKGGKGKAGTQEEVVNDVYTVDFVFGLRVVN